MIVVFVDFTTSILCSLFCVAVCLKAIGIITSSLRLIFFNVLLLHMLDVSCKMAWDESRPHHRHIHTMTQSIFSNLMVVCISVTKVAIQNIPIYDCDLQSPDTATADTATADTVFCYIPLHAIAHYCADGTPAWQHNSINTLLCILTSQPQIFPHNWACIHHQQVTDMTSHHYTAIAKGY